MVQDSAKLSVRHKSVLTATDLGTDSNLDFYPADPRGVIWNGALYLLCKWSGRQSGTASRSALFRFSHDGAREQIDLDDAQLAALQGASITPTSKGWVLVPQSTQFTLYDPVAVNFLPADGTGFGTLRTIEIHQDLPVFRKSPEEQPFFRKLPQETGHILHGGPTSDGYVVAVPFRTAAHIRSIAFLELDREYRTAAWRSRLSAPRKSLVDRLRRTFRSAEVPALGFDDLMSLNKADFPDFPGYEQYPIVPLEVSTDGQSLYAFSRGSKDRVKYGAPGAVLAEIGADGGTRKRIHYEDHRQSSQNHSRMGFFADQGRSFVMRSDFAQTDPWKGGWACVSLSDGKLTELHPPRGCKGMKVLDVEKQSGWFWRGENDGSLSIWHMEW